jgi:hypothetical protein
MIASSSYHVGLASDTIEALDIMTESPSNQYLPISYHSSPFEVSVHDALYGTFIFHPFTQHNPARRPSACVSGNRSQGMAAQQIAQALQRKTALALVVKLGAALLLIPVWCCVTCVPLLLLLHCAADPRCPTQLTLMLAGSVTTRTCSR